MADPEVLERIAARRAELGELEERLDKQLAEVRAERDKLAVAERFLRRMDELADRPPRGGCCGSRRPSPGAPRRSPPAATTTLTDRIREAGLGVIADLGFVGLDKDPDNLAIITGCKAARGKPLGRPETEVDKLIASERAVCEHAFAHLKNWTILTKLRLDVRYATALVRALMVLTLREVAR